MGRVARKTARVQVNARLTWTFSARARIGRGRPRHSWPVVAVGRPATATLLRSLLRAACPRPRPGSTPPHTRHTRRAAHR
ncbi:hypothetical protein [Streptomyces shenzhenensis]|uniref:hypothetical protein n=1 Tax=Streptomyces shenzhenensis TaxID=943815 RepID=UPI0033E4562C